MAAGRQRMTPGCGWLGLVEARRETVFKRPRYAARADRELGRRGVLAIATKVAPGLASLAINLLIGRVGGVALLGLTQIAMSTGMLVSLLYSAPAAAAASRFVSAAVAEGAYARATRIASYLARRVLFATACFVSMIFTLTAIFQFFNMWLVVVTGIITIGISFRVFFEGLHFGGGESVRLAQWSIAIGAFGVMGTAALLSFGVRDAWVIVPMAAANMFFVAVSWPTRSAYRLNVTEKRNIREFIWLGTIGTLASAGFTQATTLVAVAVAGIAFAGEYAAGLTLTTPLAIFSVAVSATLFPALSALNVGEDSAKVRSHVIRATSLMVTVMGAATCVFFILSEPIVAFIWGSEFERTSWIVVFLLTSVLSTAVAVPSVTALTSSSNAGMKVSALSSLTGAVVGALTWVVAVPWSAEIGVMAGCTVAAVLSASIPYLIAWRRYKLPWTGQTLEFLVLLVVCWSLAGLLEMSTLPLGLSPFVALGVLGGWIVLRRQDVRRIWAMMPTARGLSR